MKTFITVFFVSLILGAAFTGTSYFVFQEEDHIFECLTPASDTALQTPEQKQFNTYKTTENGFPFTFYTKVNTPKSDGCQQPEVIPTGVSVNSEGKIIATSELSKPDFAKDMAVWSSVFFVLGILLFGVRKKQ